MNINVVFDSSVTNPLAPAPAAFQQDVIDVAEMLASQFTDPITFTVHVGYGEIAGSRMGRGALGNSIGPSEDPYTYAALRDGVQADSSPGADDQAASASLPADDPIAGSHVYQIGEVNAAALGLIAPPSEIDTFVGFSKSAAFDYDRSDGIGSHQYDFLAVVAHEITEVMGRYLDTGASTPATYNLLDLFHYDSPGNRDFSALHPGYFSVDGGVTPLAAFNTASGGDPGDWADPDDNPGLSHYAGNDSFNAFSNSGVENSISDFDLATLDVIGYDRVSDDIRGSAATGRTLAVDTADTGNIEACLDQDWFQCTLTAGATYFIREQGIDHGGGSLTDPFLRLYDATGTRVAFNDSADARDSRIVFTPTISGTYYISAGAHKDGFDNGTFYLGTYTVRLTQDDVGDEASDASPMAVPAVTDAAINYAGDRDWFAVHLVAGFAYDFTERGERPGDSSNGTLSDPYLRLYDVLPANGPIAENDNETGGPPGDNDATIHFVPTVSGDYFLAAGASGDAATGTYTLTTSVNDSAPDGLTLSNAHVAENRPTGAVVGTINDHDPDPGDSLSLSLTADPSGKFAIAGNQLVAATPLDYEQAHAYAITLRATDIFGKSFDQSFVIAVDNVSPEVINGTKADDRLIGGSDVDFITGGLGKDRMTGHGAGDHFIFRNLAASKPGARHDVITDFDQASGGYVHAEGDRIDLTGLEAVHHVHFGFTAQAITHAGPRNHLGFDGAHSLLQLDLDGNGTVDFEVALTNLHHFGRADLLL